MPFQPPAPVSLTPAALETPADLILPGELAFHPGGYVVRRVGTDWKNRPTFQRLDLDASYRALVAFDGSTPLRRASPSVSL